MERQEVLSLVRLKLENFKSYVEPVSLEWRQVTQIVGPNGVGKSSIVDAIEFVFCSPPYDKISINDLRKAICNKTCDNSSSRVQATFEYNGKEIIFQRSGCYMESKFKYTINGVDVFMEKYKEILLEYNINCRANHFSVKQNSIESIALASAKSRCDFFERMSDSIAYKREYNRLSQQLEIANLEALHAKEDLHFYSKQRQQLEKTSKEAQKYDKMRNELEKIELNFYLAKLYQIDDTLEKRLKEQKEPNITIEITEKMKKETEDAIAHLKNQLKEHEARLDKLNAESEETTRTVSKYNKKKSELKQKLVCCENNIKKLETNLKNAQKMHEARKQVLKDLKHQYQDVEQERENYMNSHSMRCSLKLEANQYEEYLKLKSEAQQQCSREIGLFDSIERRRDAIKDELDEYETKKNVLTEQIHKENAQLNEIRSKLEQINKKIKETEITEQNCKIASDSLKTELEKLMKEAEFLTIDIEKLGSKILESKEMEYEDKKSKQKQEILDKLKSHFPGVQDRLVNLCEISDERYEVAITKLIGNTIDNIVVDDMPTAINCIRYLKEQYVGSEFSAVETFLPLDNLQVKSVDKVLRSIQDKPKAKLAVDVMNFYPDGIQRVLLQVLGDSVICENDNEASQLSHERKLNCVSLNGTYYKKDGTISGGLASLLEKSKKWKTSKINKQKEERKNLKQEKQNKSMRLKELQKTIHELKDAICASDVQLKGLQGRLKKYLEPNFKEQKKVLEDKERELQKLKDDLDKLITTSPTIKELKKELDKLNEDVERIEMQKNRIEDEVFEQFCQRFNIYNIREYEQGDFRKQKELDDRKKDFDNHLNRIKNQHDYEHSRDTKTPIKQLQIQLNNSKELYQKLKDQEDELIHLINDNDLNRIKKDELKSEKEKVEKIKRNMKLEQIKCSAMKRDLKQLNSTIASINAHIYNLLSEKHELLKVCKVNSIDIPLINGTIDKIVLKSKAEIEMGFTESSNEYSTDSDSQIKEKNIEIDYTKLENIVKKLEEPFFNNYICSLKRKQDTLRNELEQLCIDVKSVESLKKIEETIVARKKEFNEKCETAASAKKKFDKFKKKRQFIFIKFFNSVAEKIDKIFKDLYGNEAAQAQINVTNEDESYLGGINLSCIIPNKKFGPIESLSGGEKTMCAMALLLSIFSVKPAPFLILDEIDAALDKYAIRQISSYFELLKSSTQIIIISHHKLFDFCPDAVIGINISSRTQSSYAVHISGKRYQKKMLP